jgi:hypothetical protein
VDADEELAIELGLEVLQRLADQVRGLGEPDGRVRAMAAAERVSNAAPERR